MFRKLRHRFRNKKGGQTMTEYVMIFTAIAILAFAAYRTLGSEISNFTTTLANMIGSA